jgi:hypothetical protein
MGYKVGEELEKSARADINHPRHKTKRHRRKEIIVMDTVGTEEKSDKSM